MAAILLATITGCGTMLNMDGKEKVDLAAASVPTPDGKPNVPKYLRPTFPFGGIANDVAWIKDSKEPTEVVFSLVDMPFSLVGDIITLPWIAHERLRGVRPNANEEWKNFWLNTTEEQEETHLKSPAPNR